MPFFRDYKNGDLRHKKGSAPTGSTTPKSVSHICFIGAGYVVRCSLTQAMQNNVILSRADYDLGRLNRSRIGEPVSAHSSYRGRQEC